MPWNQPPNYAASSRAKANAKALRREMTGPEKRLWWHLRHRLSLEGSHFRRQVAIGPYVVDFCCLPARLVIEVDGNQHGFDGALAYDAKRTAYLEGQGFRVLRFGNHEVMRGIDVVLETIHAALAMATPTPLALRASRPSPQGGGEKENVNG
jgi:very-short-patch-repair endonuclease